MPIDKDGGSYMDGVPVKITEKYKRRPIIRLPNSCLNCQPGPSFYDQYDFTLEKSVIGKMEEWKKARETDTQEREEKVKRWNSFCNESAVTEQQSKTGQSEVEKSSVTSDLPSNILTPITASSVVQNIPRRNPAFINYSEFETDNNPFDNVELKAMNDMEVLASVLSTSSDSQAASVNKIPIPNHPNNSLMNRNGAVWKKWDDYDQFSSHQQQFYHSPPQYSNSVAQGYLASNYVPQESWPVGSNQGMYSTSPLIGGYQTQYQPSTSNQKIKTSLESQRKNSKSVPDLVMELEKELKDKKLLDEERKSMITPPPKPGTTKSLDSKNFEGPRNGESELFYSLSPSDQSLAKNIREMGFPLERIIRTIQKFDGDDKKIIEFLILVQRFVEDKKFSGDLVESALHANNYNEEETLKHLQAASVLLDLGFSQDKVQQVLLECKNDRDLALDKLIS